MHKPFQEIALADLDEAMRQATLGAVVDSLARDLPVCGTENGVVTTRYPGDPAFEHLRPLITARKWELASTKQG